MTLSTVVIDSGSFETRIGYSGHHEPLEVIPSAVCVDSERSYAGTEAFKSCSPSNVRFPIQKRQIVDIADMQLLWQFCFDELDGQPEEHPLVVTEPPTQTNALREQTIEVFFETFNVPRYFNGSTSVFSLISFDLASGIVVDGGHTDVCVTPIYHFMNLPFLSKSFPNGGLAQDMQLLKTTSQHSAEELRRIKSQFLAGTLTDAQVDKDAMGTALDIPLAELELTPIIQNYTQETNIHDPNLVLAGGVMRNPSLGQHIEASTGISPLTYTAPEHIPWRGASKLASLTVFSQLWISNSEYKEVGSFIANTKRF